MVKIRDKTQNTKLFIKGKGFNGVFNRTLNTEGYLSQMKSGGDLGVNWEVKRMHLNSEVAEKAEYPVEEYAENTGNFKVGTRIKGSFNGMQAQIKYIRRTAYSTESGNVYWGEPYAILEDMSSKQVFKNNIRYLETLLKSGGISIVKYKKWN